MIHLEILLFRERIEKRKEMISELDQKLIDEAPFVLLYYDEILRFLQPNVKGMEINPINMLDLRNVRKEKS